MKNSFLHSILNYISQILDLYDKSFHHIFAKGFRYAITGKVKLLDFNVTDNNFFSLWGVSNHYVLVFKRYNKPLFAICTCPDFLFNVTLDSDQSSRKFCSHIIASFLCLGYLLSHGKSKGHIKFSCSISNSNLSREDIKIVLRKIWEIDYEE